MTEPRDLPRVSAREFVEELGKVRGEDGHIFIERLLLDHRDTRAELESLRARLADTQMALEKGVSRCMCHPDVRWPVSHWGSECPITKAEKERDAALRERNQWIDTCEQTGNKMHAEHHRAEAAEARLARLRERLEGWSQLAHAQPHTTLGECADSLRMTDAALAETVSAAPSIVKLSETHMGEGSPKPPARTPSEIPCMNEQWNGQDISDAMPCDCPQCRIEPPVLPQEPK